MPLSKAPPITIVTGVIGIEDPHVIGTKVISQVLRSEGFNVVSLGAKCTQEEFVNAARESAAKAIMVSSMAGQGEINCRGFRDRCTEAGLKDILLYAGGNLVVGKLEWPGVHETFMKMGFNRVYPPGSRPRIFLEDLRADLGIAESAHIA